MVTRERPVVLEVTSFPSAPICFSGWKKGMMEPVWLAAMLSRSAWGMT